MENFEAEYELNFLVKSNSDKIMETLEAISRITSEEFNKIKSGETGLKVTPTVIAINDNDATCRIDNINYQISKLKYKGNISDGSHTFDELYYHRMVLVSIICNTYRKYAWKSWNHHDGSMFEDYFIVGVSIDGIGDYTYHFHKYYWDNFMVKEMELAPIWDGHRPNDIGRLYNLLLCDNK